MKPKRYRLKTRHPSPKTMSPEILAVFASLQVGERVSISAPARPNINPGRIRFTFHHHTGLVERSRSAWVHVDTETAEVVRRFQAALEGARQGWGG